MARGVVLVHRGGLNADSRVLNPPSEPTRDESLKHHWPATGVRCRRHPPRHAQKLKTGDLDDCARHQSAVPSTVRCGPAEKIWLGHATRRPRGGSGPDAEPEIDLRARPSRPSTGSRQYASIPRSSCTTSSCYACGPCSHEHTVTRSPTANSSSAIEPEPRSAGHAGHVAIAEAM